jgi:hypothetical protein
MTDVDDTRDGPPSRRTTPERRRYNRRAPAADSTAPPYHETFERIAVALEGIRDQLAGAGTVVLPGRPARGRTPPAAREAGTSS